MNNSELTKKYREKVRASARIMAQVCDGLAGEQVDDNERKRANEHRTFRLRNKTLKKRARERDEYVSMTVVF